MASRGRIHRPASGGKTLHRIPTSIRAEDGQTTAEYALVLLVAAMVVGVFAAFVKSGAMDDLFRFIISGLVERARG